MKLLTIAVFTSLFLCITALFESCNKTATGSGLAFIVVCVIAFFKILKHDRATKTTQSNDLAAFKKQMRRKVITPNTDIDCEYRHHFEN